MISVHFNTVSNGYDEDELGSSNRFEFFSFTGKKIVSNEVLSTDQALTWSHFTLDPNFLIANSEWKQIIEPA